MAIMDTLGQRIGRIKKKQREIEEIKGKIALRQESIDDFKVYLLVLPRDQDCKYMGAVGGIFSLCSNSLPCRFQGEKFKAGAQEERPECLRSRILKFEEMLRH